MNKSVVHFHTDARKMGRPQWSEFKDGVDFRLRRQDMAYVTDSSDNASNDFTYTSQECTTTYIRGGQSNQHRVNYSYERQSNVQYGNLTRIEEEGYIGGLSNQKRLIYREYYPNTTNWIVGAVAREAVFTGTQGTPIDPATATPTSNKRNYYDGNTNWNNPPTAGKLTKVMQLKTGTTYITTQQMAYNASDGVYGLPTTITDGNNNDTNIDYDDIYRLYPISIANELGHTRYFYYYNLNTPASSPVATHASNYSPPGLLAEQTDPNNLIAYYVHDRFGRLERVYRGWAEQGSNWTKPSEIYQYNDSEFPLRITSWRKTQDNATAWMAGGVFERTFYDGFGRPIQVQTPHTDWSGNAISGANTGQRRIVCTLYDAAGQAVRQSEPYLVPSYSGSGSYYVTPDFGVNPIVTGYNAAGQAVRQIGLDFAATSAVYGLRSLYSEDGNNHIKASYFDFVGQLVAVDETVDKFFDDFEDGNLNNWGQSGNVTIGSSDITITGNGSSWSSQISRSLATTGDGGASFTFQSVNSNLVAQMFLQYGTYGQSNYRRWAIQIAPASDGSGQAMFKLQEWDAGGVVTTTELMPFRTYISYRVMLRGSQSNASFALVIWEEHNPQVMAERRVSHTASPWGEGGQFYVQLHTGTVRFDNYDELEFNRTKYEYDILGNLTKVTTPPASSTGTSFITTMTYDKLGRKTGMSDPDMGNWSYGYDNAGNLTAQTGNGQALTFTYDSLNRLTSKYPTDDPDKLFATYTYDDTANGNKGRGFRTGMIAYDPPPVVSNSASWKYDSLGRMTQETRTIGTNTYTFQHSYTQGNLPVTITYPGGNSGQLGEVVTTNYYWQTGQPKTHIGASNYVQEAQYNRADGQITRLNMPNTSVYTTFGYEMGHRVNAIRTISSGTDRLWLNYIYDKAGNITWIQDVTNVQNLSFNYDSLNRLVHAETSSSGNGQYVDDYQYDALGNLTNKDGVTMGYGQPIGIASGAKPHAVTHLSGTQKYSYASNGNMYTRHDGTTAWTYNWTWENMLKTATGGSNTLSFVYDADNQVVQRVANGTTLVMLGKLYEHNITGGIVKKYYQFNGRMAALRRIGPGGNAVYYFASDHLGSNTVLLNSGGTIRHNVRYDPWGKERWSTGLVESNYQYTGQWNDTTLGLYNYNARYYDPAIGKFISADTIVPNPASLQSFNRYSYVRNNPLNFTDPTGHMDQCMCDGGINLGDIFNAYHAGEFPGVGPEMTMLYLNALHEFFRQNPDYDMGVNPGLMEGDYSDAVFAQMRVLADEYSDRFDSNDTATALGAGALASGLGPNGDGMSDLMGGGSASLQSVNGRLPRNSQYAGSTYYMDGALGQKYPNGVNFTEDGYPDFSPYATHQVDIDMKGNYTTDYANANQAAGLTVTPQEYTWHHHQDGRTMQLVPRELHDAVGHTGGVAITRGR